MPSAPVVALVDDDPSVRRALDRLLVAAGFAVRSFASGAEILDSGVGESAACLLLDVHLVGMTGFELLEQLRARGAPGEVIFMTARDSRETRGLVAATGARWFLRKPFDESDLLDAVRLAIAARPD